MQLDSPLPRYYGDDSIPINPGVKLIGWTLAVENKGDYWVDIAPNIIHLLVLRN
jgi:hypothetical protein